MSVRVDVFVAPPPTARLAEDTRRGSHRGFEEIVLP